jgi:hypothetical protein
LPREGRHAYNVRHDGIGLEYAIARYPKRRFQTLPPKILYLLLSRFLKKEKEHCEAVTLYILRSQDVIWRSGFKKQYGWPVSLGKVEPRHWDQGKLESHRVTALGNSGFSM